MKSFWAGDRPVPDRPPGMPKERYWSRFARDYDARVGYAVGARNIGIIKLHLSQLKHFGDVLELGCGQGVFTDVLRHGADRITATDLSAEMVAVAAERFSGRPDITVQQADCLELDHPDAAFDTVFMGNLLHVIPTPEKALAQVRRVIKPGGRLIVVSYTMEGMPLFRKLAMIYRYFRVFGKPSPTAVPLTVQKASTMIGRARFSIDTAQLIGETSHAIYVTARAV